MRVTLSGLFGVLFIVLLIASNADATIVQDICLLEIDSVNDDGYNLYGWHEGDSITFTIEYDNLNVPDTGQYFMTWDAYNPLTPGEVYPFVVDGLPFFEWDGLYTAPFIEFMDGNLISLWSQANPIGPLYYGIDGPNYWTSGYDAPIGYFYITGHITYGVTEPSTMFFLGSGLIGLAGFRRKCRKI